jgi:hypothetical protein
MLSMIGDRLRPGTNLGDERRDLIEQPEELAFSFCSLREQARTLDGAKTILIEVQRRNGMLSRRMENRSTAT